MLVGEHIASTIDCPPTPDSIASLDGNRRSFAQACINQQDSVERRVALLSYVRSS
jgi:hypothetical protein